MLEQQPNEDYTDLFDQLWSVTTELRQKIDARFQLHPDPSTNNLQSYSSLNGEAHGTLNTFSGSEIDWLVHSWLRNPKSGFSHMRLIIWLGPQINVPHLAYGFATLPHLFFYMDYIPRSDLLADLNYLDRYFQPGNERYLELRKDTQFEQYISRNLYIRQAQSPTNLCCTSKAAKEKLPLVRTLAHEMMDRWLTWVDSAEPVAEDKRAALAERDLTVLRAIAERDPDNQIAVQMFGKELADQLVRSLWGGDRMLKSGS
ncbi:red chlorophyll catabolite reductase [Calothrix sp. NIES-2100]|uniref:red chlorophyll catabolite reductase n=1 Tax=Calothrix sp. NIES-2100 TaxID=1954172 RepID=UPI000B60F856|nr:red chlorophyll catabolite reductase [Calothrix sp. NIES-2100]